MSKPPQTPQAQRLRELLTDGLWREKEFVLRELGKVIPPGVALRRNEADRLRRRRTRIQAGLPVSTTPERKIQRSQEYRIDRGRRRLAVTAISRPWIETKVVDGKEYLRDRRLPLPSGDPNE